MKNGKKIGDDKERYAGGMPGMFSSTLSNENTFVGYGINLFLGPTLGSAVKSPMLKKRDLYEQKL
jgi:hypothetical protein